MPGARVSPRLLPGVVLRPGVAALPGVRLLPGVAALPGPGVRLLPGTGVRLLPGIRLLPGVVLPRPLHYVSSYDAPCTKELALHTSKSLLNDERPI